MLYFLHRAFFVVYVFCSPHNIVPYAEKQFATPRQIIISDYENQQYELEVRYETLVWSYAHSYEQETTSLYSNCLSK